MRKTIPNLILLDLVMPNKDGFGVLEEKKADPQIANIPVVIFSTLGQEEDIKRAMGLGATDYINKSFFDFDKLVTKITAIIPK
jgi:two-component system response regulator